MYITLMALLKKVILHKFLLWFDHLIFFCYHSNVLLYISDVQDWVFNCVHS